MPYPHDPRAREPSDARAALMAKLSLKLTSSQVVSPEGPMRSRYLQAERPKPYYRLPSRGLPTECRKSRNAPDLGYGAFLKGETLRSPQGAIIRLAGPRPNLAGASVPPSECLLLPQLGEESSVEGTRALRRACTATRADIALLDGFTPLWIRPTSESQAVRRRCSRESLADCNYDLLGCAIIGLERKRPPLLEPTSEPEGMSELLCIRAADEMFSMFIDESCMEESDSRGLTSILSYSNAI